MNDANDSSIFPIVRKILYVVLRRKMYFFKAVFNQY